jgi:predicted Zn-dependent protease
MVQTYVQNLVERIGKASDMPDLKFTVQVIDADVLNAFALPGGYVFVYRGLIEASENESELAGVLSHEIAHVTSRHGTEGMTSAIAKVVGATILGGIAANKLGGDDVLVKSLISGVVMTGTQFWILGGTRKREAEADHLGAEYAWRAGYDPRGLGDFFKTLSASRDAKQTRMDQFFSDHPNDEERVKANARDTGYFLPPKSDLIVSSAEYTAVKARLKGMAPSQASGEIAADALFSGSRPRTSG